MESNTDFDKNFKDQIGQMDFEFKEAYWTEMEAILNQKKKKRGLVFWLWSSFGIAAVLALGLIWVYTPGQKTDLSKEIIQEKEVSISEKPADQTANHDNNATQSAENQNSNVINQEADHVINQISEHNTYPADQKNNKHQNSTSSNHAANSENETTSNSINPYEDVTRIENDFRNEETVNLQSIYAAQENKIDIQKIDRLLNAEALELKQKELTPTARIESEQPKNNEIRSHVGIIGGVNFSQSLKHNNETVGGMGAHLGLRFYFASKKGLLFNTGLSFGMNGIQGLVFAEHRKIYGFTNYDVVNLIEYNTMTTAHIPIYLGFEGNKISVSGGLRLNYLMNTKGRVFAYDNSIYDANIWGYANGVKMFNMSGGLEGTYRLGRRFDVSMSIEMDLSPRTEVNNPFISSNAQMWQMGVFIKYRLN